MEKYQLVLKKLNIANCFISDYGIKEFGKIISESPTSFMMNEIDFRFNMITHLGIKDFVYHVSRYNYTLTNVLIHEEDIENVLRNANTRHDAFDSDVIANITQASDPNTEWREGMESLQRIVRDNENNYNCVIGNSDYIMIVDRPGFSQELLKSMLEKAKDFVVVLDLIGCQFTSIPNNIDQLTKIEILNLSGNYLTKIPESIGRLEHSLREVNFASNPLLEFPVSIGLLPLLETINIEFTNIDKIPKTVVQLQKLTYLYVGFKNFDGSDKELYLPDSTIKWKSDEKKISWRIFTRNIKAIL